MLIIILRPAFSPDIVRSLQKKHGASEEEPGEECGAKMKRKLVFTHSAHTSGAHVCKLWQSWNLSCLRPFIATRQGRTVFQWLIILLSKLFELMP